MPDLQNHRINICSRRVTHSIHLLTQELWLAASRGHAALRRDISAQSCHKVPAASNGCLYHERSVNIRLSEEAPGMFLAE